MRIEYKIVDTADVGVPLKGDGTYDQRLKTGLDELGRDGWLLQVVSGTKMIFARRWRRKVKNAGH